MISFQKTKRKRASSRRTATILIHKVEEALRKGSDGDEWKKLEHFRDELEERRTELKRLDEEILDTLLEDAEEEEINKENDETNEYREKIGCTILAIKDSLLATSQGKWSRTNSLESLSSLTSTKGGTKKVQVKLPKFNLRPFSGKIHEWQEFWDGFNSAVHQNEDLANVEKLNYLKGFLEEKARHVIAGIPTTDDSYETAINLLTKRFGKPNVIQRAHVNQLISASPVYSEKNVARLRGMHDEIEIHLRGLEALGVDMATYSGFVVPVLMDKIPETMRLNMIRFHEKDQMDWTLQDFLDGFEKEISVRESHVPLKTLTGSTGGSGYSGVGGDRRNRQVPSRDDFGTANALLTERAVAEKNCAYCLHKHDPAECKTVRSTQERKNILRKYARCFVCLMSGHRGFECRSNIICKHCRGKHHTSICNRPKQGASAISLDRESSPKPGSEALNPNATTWVGSTYCGERVALQTALGKVKERKECVVRVLFDAGSHQSFITAKAAGKIGLQAVKQERLSVKTFGKNEVETKMRDIVDFDLSSVNNQQSARIQCYVVDEITTIPNERIDIMKNDFDHLKQIYFSDATKHGETLQVDILIGANFLWEFMSGQIIRGGPQQPVAIKTLLGWTLSGPLKAGKLHYLSHVNVNFVSSMNKSDKQHLDELVHKLWDLDSIGIREGDHVHETLIDNIHFTGERYQVGLPWKVGHGDLPSNYDISLMRLQCQLKKLRKDPVTLRKYDDIIREQEETGIIEKVPALGNVGRTHYLAHQAVVREDAETTKVRIVFDASCKSRKSGISLNDCLHVGPPMTPFIFDLLLRFRGYSIALTGDIEKAFLNIEINEKDKDFLRFLWIESISEDEPKIVVYRFNRVVFGVNSSPFILNAVLRHHIQTFKDVDPEFVRKLIDGFYVDDLVTGCSAPTEAIALYEKSKERMQKGGFKLRKWKSNDKDVQNKIQEMDNQNVKKEDGMNESSFTKESLGQASEPGEKSKVLGIVWDTKEDTLEFKLSKMLKEGGNIPTKRGILSTLASLFDPLGILSPVAVMAKTLFQNLCVEGVGWDELLPVDKLSVWENWLQELKEIGTVKIPRYVHDQSIGEIQWCQLHGFGDASMKAYSAVVYMVYGTAEGTFSKLLCSKTRVAPLKSLSIPRLELMSARILAVLMNTVKNALQSQIKIDKIRLWLDSKTALYWIQNNNEWKQFVQHRVNEILDLTTKCEWGHVSGLENPADVGSRGVTIRQLIKSDLWWEGPKWLRKQEDDWPKTMILTESEDVKEDQKKCNVLSVMAEKQPRLSEIIDLGRFSALSKLLRVTAWVRRFIDNVRRKKEKQDVLLEPLSATEIEKSEASWVKDSQIDLQQSAEFDKTRTNLDIRQVSDILICHGRLENSDYDLGAKFPMVLPRDHKFTELIIWDCHQKVHHCKVRATLAEVRARFWITKGRQYIKRVLKGCFICKKLEGKAFDAPIMAPLPAFRVSEAPPFSTVGIDFAGPLYCKTKKGMTKCYIALFSCGITRAIHLELVYDLSTPTFICCLRRFCARRGTPSIIVSDNARTFKAAHKLLKKLKTDQTFEGFIGNKRIEWKFNLERSPWWGGHFERMVGQVKRCLRKVLGNAKLSFEELYTVFTEVENTLNSRPLTYDYDEPGVEMLTPSHLIFGRRVSALADGIDRRVNTTEFDEVSNVHKRFSYLTRILSLFWNRWKKEYLVGLREAHKSGKHKSSNIDKGDVVLVQDENMKRGMWKIAIVEDLIVGKDDVVRGAKVRKAGRGKPDFICRPLQRLYPLEIVGARIEAKGRNGVECRKQSGMREENSHASRRSQRAAAKDAQCKTRLMLDSF